MFLKGMLGRLRGVPLSVLERCLTASEMADAGGTMSSSCSAVESGREKATGELGMEREDCPDSSLKDGGARLSFEGRLRANLDGAGCDSVLGPAMLLFSGITSDGAEGSED